MCPAAKSDQSSAWLETTAPWDRKFSNAWMESKGSSRCSAPSNLPAAIFKKEDTVFSIDGSHIGSKKIIVMAGPCAVENRDQIIKSALAVKKSGAVALRGGAFKPRTSPYSFQGLGEEGLKLLAEARDIAGLAVVTEVTAPEQVALVAQYADVLQIGARNMQNFTLLHAAGESHKPVSC